jgi:hypothetical protein
LRRSPRAGPGPGPGPHPNRVTCTRFDPQAPVWSRRSGTPQSAGVDNSSHPLRPSVSRLCSPSASGALTALAADPGTDPTESAAAGSAEPDVRTQVSQPFHVATKSSYRMVLEGIWGGDREGGPRLGHVLRGSAARTGRSPVCFFEPNLVKAKYAVIDVWGEQVSTLTVGMNVTDIFASQDDLLRICREGPVQPQHGRPGTAGALRYDDRARPAGPPFRTSTGAAGPGIDPVLPLVE